MAKLTIDENKTIKTNSVTFLEMLFLLFLGLKLADKIDWSWWWVFSPIWVPLVAVGILFAIVGVIVLVEARSAKKTKKQQ